MTDAERYEEWFKSMDDPNVRGSSEYHAVYETLNDAMEEPEEMDAQTLRTSLRNKREEKQT